MKSFDSRSRNEHITRTLQSEQKWTYYFLTGDVFHIDLLILGVDPSNKEYDGKLVSDSTRCTVCFSITCVSTMAFTFEVPGLIYSNPLDGDIPYVNMSVLTHGRVWFLPRGPCAKSPSRVSSTLTQPGITHPHQPSNASLSSVNLLHSLLLRVLRGLVPPTHQGTLSLCPKDIR